MGMCWWVQLRRLRQLQGMSANSIVQGGGGGVCTELKPYNSTPAFVDEAAIFPKMYWGTIWCQVLPSYLSHMYHGNHNCSDRCRRFSIMTCQKEKVLDPTFHFVGEGVERVEELMIPVQVFVLGQSLTKIFFFLFFNALY